MTALSAALQDPSLAAVRCVALGGFVNHRKPLALMLALARARPDFAPTTLVCLSGSVDLDLALAFWPSIRTVHCPFVGIEGLATVSPLLKRELEAGDIALPPWDTGLMSLALRASEAAPTATLTGLGTDLPRLNPALSEREGRVWVSRLQVDLALLHVPQVSSAGIVWYLDSPWGDGLLLTHAARSIASTGAVADPPPTAHGYAASERYICLELPHPTGPTADPPRCVADPAILSQAIEAGRSAQGAAAVRDFWQSIFPPLDSGLIKLPTQHI